MACLEAPRLYNGKSQSSEVTLFTDISRLPAISQLGSAQEGVQTDHSRLTFSHPQTEWSPVITTHEAMDTFVCSPLFIRFGRPSCLS